MISTFEDRTPQIGPAAYVHPSAAVLGHVRIGAGCWIGPGARIRGDYGQIEIGDHTAVEDNCVIHARPGEQTTIGRWVTLGHACIVHNATIHDWAIIGMGAILLNRSRVGRNCIVAAGSVVREDFVVPAGSLVAGVPAVVKRLLTPEEIERIRRNVADYAARAQLYRGELAGPK